MQIKSIILLYYLTSKPPSANTFGPDELQAINPKYDFKLRLSFQPFFLLPFSKIPAKRKINAIDKKNRLPGYTVAAVIIKSATLCLAEVIQQLFHTGRRGIYINKRIGAAHAGLHPTGMQGYRFDTDIGQI